MSIDRFEVLDRLEYQVVMYELAHRSRVLSDTFLVFHRAFLELYGGYDPPPNVNYFCCISYYRLHQRGTCKHWKGLTFICINLARQILFSLFALELLAHCWTRHPLHSINAHTVLKKMLVLKSSYRVIQQSSCRSRPHLEH